MMRTGLTPALFDQKQRQSMPLSYFPTIANEAAIHFYARYRAITGVLRHDVYILLSGFRWSTPDIFLMARIIF